MLQKGMFILGGEVFIIHDSLMISFSGARFMTLLKILITLMPSVIKIWCFRAMGASIAEGCYIGFSIIDANNLVLGKCVYIGHFNILWRLNNLELESGSRVTLFNWITGGREGSFYLGRNSSLSFGHFLEASSNIRIGNNCIIAGRYSQFISHGITPYDLDDRRPIHIGDWCYIGSAARFLPGTGVSDHTFVGMGSVVTKSILENYVLVAGCPARIKKSLPKEAIFFKRSHLPQPHHTASYNG
jgi:acetyltransferase-like isoleucine patch superfamily enzyme